MSALLRVRQAVNRASRVLKHIPFKKTTLAATLLSFVLISTGLHYTYQVFAGGQLVHYYDRIGPKFGHTSKIQQITDPGSNKTGMQVWWIAPKDPDYAPYGVITEPQMRLIPLVDGWFQPCVTMRRAWGSGGVKIVVPGQVEWSELVNASNDYKLYCGPSFFLRAVQGGYYIDIETYNTAQEYESPLLVANMQLRW